MEPWESCWLPDDISYDEWVRFVFDHPVLEPTWWRQPPESGYLQLWDDYADRELTLSYITQLFEYPEELSGRFSRAQIDQGLYFLVSDANSDQMDVLWDVTLPWANRRRCIEAMIPLYVKLMAAVYDDDLGHSDRTPNDPERPNIACYMWWDVIPLHGDVDPSERELVDEAVLGVLEQLLTFKAEAVLESALHGLGHWHMHAPQCVEPMVRKFLERPDLGEEIRSYAERAAYGYVL